MRRWVQAPADLGVRLRVTEYSPLLIIDEAAVEEHRASGSDSRAPVTSYPFTAIRSNFTSFHPPITRMMNKTGISHGEIATMSTPILSMLVLIRSRRPVHKFPDCNRDQTCKNDNERNIGLTLRYVR